MGQVDQPVRTVLVTGAARGLGRVMALALLDDGHRVILSATDRDALSAVIKESGAGSNYAQMIVADLSQSGEAERLADEVGIDRALLFPDTIMAQPIRFLALEASSNFTTRRIMANIWDKEIPAVEAAKLASDPIAWSDIGAAGVHPEIAQA